MKIMAAPNDGELRQYLLFIQNDSERFAPSPRLAPFLTGSALFADLALPAASPGPTASAEIECISRPTKHLLL
jgi:hypothetical protein